MKAYTLIELLIILSVILILIAMAIPSFEGMRDRTKITAAKGAIETLRMAQIFYRQDKNFYTNSLTDLYKYGSITPFLKDLQDVPPIMTTSGDVLTIVSRAKDSKYTYVTGTEKRTVACNVDGCVK